VGDRGVTLSGGQKARLGLARALYQDKEIYLMDDPISALDAHVRGQIIKNVYFGALKDRTRILVTHAVDFLPKADHIILMHEGRIVGQGTYKEMESYKEF
jgi:ABC-type multidrug transport system fused ATPase/permease subunit